MRASQVLLIRYLTHDIPSLYVLARRTTKKYSEDVLNRKMQKSLNAFLQKTPWPDLPSQEELVAIADAMILTLNRQTFAVYFIIIRRLNEQRAIIAPPYVKEGPESCQGWFEAFSSLPPQTLKFVRVLVCDSHLGLISYAKRNEWLIQRCHFHLLAALQGRRSRWARSRHRQEGQRIYELANTVLTSTEEYKVEAALLTLQEIKMYTTSPILRKVLSGFINHYAEYRTYFYYPQFYLPRTSNAAESLIGSIRKLSHKAHGFRTITSFLKWTCALLKFKKAVTCNGYLPTKLPR